MIDQRDALGGHLESVRVAQLMRREAALHAGVNPGIVAGERRRPAVSSGS